LLKVHLQVDLEAIMFASYRKSGSLNQFPMTIYLLPEVELMY